MNVAIVTQPLLNNYGGLLQNFAMQKVLKKLHFCPVTIDFHPPRVALWKYARSWLKTLFFRLMLEKRPFAKIKPVKRRSLTNETFVKHYLCLTKSTKKYSKCDAKKYDVVVVGSDQVWRPKYNDKIENMYLAFVKKQSTKRVAYAASFGVDNWEYSSKQTKECSMLAKKFDAISVREESGVKLCKDYLGVEATWVLDPTLLLTKEDYLPICADVPVCNEKYLAVYVLDENELVLSTYEKEAKKRGLVVKKFYADSKSTLTVSEWLAMFRDATYVVTDSFHGTIFSIIFEKEFKCVYNKERGAARFESLLNLYNSGKLEEMRKFSINWLKKALETK